MGTTSKCFLFLSLILLAGCGFPRGNHEPVQSYVLEMEEGRGLGEPDRPRSPNLPILLLSTPEPAPGFESPRMIYMNIPYEFNYYATSQWVEPPALMLAPLIVQRLEDSGLWSAVVQTPTSVRSDVRLDISQVELVQEFFQPPSRIRLAVRAQLLAVRDLHVLGTRRFIIAEEAPSEDAYGGVLAAQRAVKQFLNDLTEWLQGCVHGSQNQGC